MLATVMNALQLQAALESVGVPTRVQTVRTPKIFCAFPYLLPMLHITALTHAPIHAFK
jgi:uridylate kinase